jgi:hypothetical protein
MSALDAAAQSVQELVWLDQFHNFAPEPGNLVSKRSLYRQDFCFSRFSPSGAVIGKRNSVRI